MTKYQVNTTLSNGETINSGTILIPDATTIPIANSTTLGGVMPVNKTDGMTQEVGVDSTGKLYTAPGGGGGSNMVVYDFVEGSSEFTANDVRSMYDNYSNGKRVLINFIASGFGKILIEVTSMSRTEDGSGIIGSGKANLFGLGVMEFTLALKNGTVQLSNVEYKFDESFNVTVNYDAGVNFETYYWDSYDGWMKGQYGGAAGSITGKYEYVVVKTECNLSSSNSIKEYFKVNGKCYFDGIPDNAPVRLHPGDTIEPIEHCNPNITLSAIPTGT